MLVDKGTLLKYRELRLWRQFQACLFFLQKILKVPNANQLTELKISVQKTAKATVFCMHKVRNCLLAF